MELLLATGNPKKRRELERILAGLDVRLTTLVDHDLPEPVEDGETFEANALIKARAACAGSGLVAIADDSGLAVDALDGRPGVRSARYAEDAGQGSGDEDNNTWLLTELQDSIERSARFVSVIALVTPDGREWTTTGTMEGVIIDTPRGVEGFGYDPLFLTEGQEVTNAELSPEDKDARSHRGAALRAMRPFIADLLEEVRTPAWSTSSASSPKPDEVRP